MNAVLTNTLFYQNKKQFIARKDEAKQFNTLCNGHNIIQDDIFNVIKNYSQHSDLPIEVFRIPIEDAEFCACAFTKKGMLFIAVNTFLPLSKQIFAAAHEFYHILRYSQGEDLNFPQHGSILQAQEMDAALVENEDMEANAFAGLFLVPADLLREQIEIYGISVDSIQLKDILRLMDIFAVPYKAIVLRLFEESIISEAKATELLDIDYKTIASEIEITGLSKRWQKNSSDFIDLGTLPEYISIGEKMSYVTDSRIAFDKETIKALTNRISRKGAL